MTEHMTKIIPWLTPLIFICKINFQEITASTPSPNWIGVISIKISKVTSYRHAIENIIILMDYKVFVATRNRAIVNIYLNVILYVI